MVMYLLFVIECVFTWGAIGHQISGLLAEKYINQNTIVFLKETFKNENSSLIKLVTWADEIKNWRIYNNTWKWSKPLHYTSRDDPLNELENCKSNMCSIGGIANFTQLFLSENVPQETKETCIKFIIHIIGDINQPLHNYNYLRGGNGAIVRFDKRKTNMHGVWDNMILNKYLKKFNLSVDDYTNYLYSKMEYSFFSNHVKFNSFNKIKWIF